MLEQRLNHRQSRRDCGICNVFKLSAHEPLA
jgi:hypothetical protein